ncbi:substrate-binding domain-containing protein [Micromonospora sp. BRA006-A]|nr:substrate-binding domain-containing protein [Micromonospora sp. BRA006-A]
MIVTPTVVETKHGFHVVAVDPHTGPSGLPTVDSDNFAGAVLATNHLLSLGHRRFAPSAAGPTWSRPACARPGSARRWPTRACRWTSGSCGWAASTETAASTAAELLALADRPTAIFAGNDLSAISTVDGPRPRPARTGGSVGHRLRQHPRVGARRPAPHHDPAAAATMGAESLRLLIDLIAGVERDTHIQLPTELVVEPPAPLR